MHDAAPRAPQKMPQQQRTMQRTMRFNELPDHLQRRILLAATTHADGSFLSHVGCCARVCAGWWLLVRDSPAYGGGIAGPSLRCRPRGTWERRQRVLAGIAVALWRARLGGEREGKLLLNVTDNSDIGDAGGQALGAALQAMPAPLNLSKINLYACAISCAGIAPIADAMRRGFAGNGLTSLFLNANMHLGDEGLAVLAPALPRTLRDLAFGSTGCGDRGLAVVALELPSLSQLETLDCGGNMIGAAGWQALARVLPELRTLRKLWTNGSSGMGDEGAAALAPGLAAAAALTFVDLSHNSIGDAGAQMLLGAALAGCRRLGVMAMRGNDVSARGVAALARLSGSVAISGLRIEIGGDSDDY